MKLEDVLDKEQLEEVKVVGEIAQRLKCSIDNYEIGENIGMRQILERIVNEDAECIIKNIVDDAFYDYMNKTGKIEE